MSSRAPLAFAREDSVEDAKTDGTRSRRRMVEHAIGIVLLLGAFVVDLNTGYELSASVFYIVPVAFAAWFLGRRSGVVCAVASAAAWLIAQRLDGISVSKPSILYLNAGVEGAIYLATAWSVARVSADKIVEHRLTAEVSRTNQALDREFAAVGDLQRDLLPQRLPEMDGYGWERHYTTSARAGGDYYDAFQLPDGRVGIFIADATGHGASAAVLMAMAKALLRSSPESLTPANQALTRLNRQLAAVLPAGWFLTACYVIVDPATGQLEYAQAGHESPLIVRASTGAAQPLLDRGGLPLGPFPDHRYQAGSAEMEPGDTLVLFTDGVTEAMDPALELFGTDRLRQALSGTEGVELEDVMRRLLAALDAHEAGAPVADDITILMLRRSSRHRARVA